MMTKDKDHPFSYCYQLDMSVSYSAISHYTSEHSQADMTPKAIEITREGVSKAEEAMSANCTLRQSIFVLSELGY